MQALILAAGEGRRLLPLTLEKPKCLIPIAGHPVIDWQISALTSAGVGRIGIVTGAHAGKVDAHVGSMRGVRTLHNPAFAVSNVLESFSLGLTEVQEDEDLIVLAGDVVFDPQVLRQLAAAEGAELYLCVNRRICGEEEVKVEGDGGQIKRLGKKLDPAMAYGEFLGVFRITRGRIGEVRRTAAAILAEGNRQAYLFDMINRLIAGHGCRVLGLETGNLAWEEIDFLEDVARADQRFAGRIPGMAAKADAKQ